MNKPKLSFAQILNMSFGFFGIQFGFALQNANVSRIFETLGANVDELALFWIAAPFTGLVVQPIIGHMSDNTWGKLGRRKPFFLIGAILASIAIFVMPNSDVLWFAVMMLWIMDASINISMEPFRALVADVLPEEQRTTGFAAQTLFIGMGAVIASALPWFFSQIGVESTAPEGIIPNTVKYSFYIGAVVYIIAVLWTVFTTKEYPPENMDEFLKKKSEAGSAFNAFITGFVDIFMSLWKMPKTMWQIALVQFFSWYALFCMWIYTTPSVAQNVFGAVDPKSALYQEAGDWVGILMAVYNGVAALFAFLLPVIAKKTSRKITHAIALSAGAIGYLSFYVIKDPNLLLFSEIGIGLAWASILTIPYSIISSAIPEEKMGVYMGIFNFFIVIPQIVVALTLGFIINNVFDNVPIYGLVLGAGSLLIGALVVLFVDDVTEKKAKA